MPSSIPILEAVVWRAYFGEIPRIGPSSETPPRYILFSSSYVLPVGTDSDDAFFARTGQSAKGWTEKYLEVLGVEAAIAGTDDLYSLNASTGQMKKVGCDAEVETGIFYSDFEDTVDLWEDQRYFPELVGEEMWVMPDVLLFVEPIPKLYYPDHSELSDVKTGIGLPGDTEMDLSKVVFYHPTRGSAVTFDDIHFSAPHLYEENGGIALDFRE